MKHLTRISLFFIVLILINTNSIVNAQINKNKILKLDTQIKSLEETPSFSNDSLQVELLNKISILYLEYSKDSALLFVNKALLNAEKLKFKNLIAISHYNKGKIYEYWKEIDNAEASFLNWCAIRKEQGGIKYRWALSGMRRFYTDTKQIEKLKKIDLEWMTVLDKQYDENIQLEWNRTKSPVEQYRLSLYPVLYNLIDLEQYFFAEELLIHMFEKDEKLRNIYWGSGDLPYYRAAYKMAANQDTTNLTIWYDHWAACYVKYSQSKDLEHIISMFFMFFPDRYFTPEIIEKYENLFYSLALKYGGYETYSYFLYSELYYNDTWNFSRIKLSLTALQISIKINNRKHLKTYLSQFDEFLNSFSVTEANISDEIEQLINETPIIISEKYMIIWSEKMKKKFE